MFDFPDPFSPVMALNSGSKPETVVRTAYDLKPSSTTSSKNIQPSQLSLDGHCIS
eukprot:COSAG06_NODE_37550_length_434_cov_0.570149_1_plen_54_part_10